MDEIENNNKSSNDEYESLNDDNYIVNKEDENNDDDDDNDEDDSNDLNNTSNSDNNMETNESKSFKELCLSPPKYYRGIKKISLKSKTEKRLKTTTTTIKHKKPKSKPKNTFTKPVLLNSADCLQPNDEQTNLTDSLTEIQDKLEQTQLKDDINKYESSKSEPSTGSILTRQPQFPTLLSQSKLVDSGYNYWKNKNDPDLNYNINPFDRQEIYNKIGRLLKIAFKTHNTSNRNNNDLILKQQVTPLVPPSTPLTSTIPLLPSQFSNLNNSNQSTHNDLNDERKRIAENIWKEIFDYFVNFNNRAETSEEIDARLQQVRNEIPQKIEFILNINYNEITSQMNYDISKNMKTPADYSFLYEHKIYTDQLCYLYWLVEEILNEIGYIESLYPSQNLLQENQPDYADYRFESTTKTLLLWYKIMKDLMQKCDYLGKYLGFTKRAEYVDYWTWFDQRLNYSRAEYERVQNWLSTSLSPTTLTDLNMSTLTNLNQSTNSNINNIQSPSIMLTRPTFCNLTQLDQPKIHHHTRQISFLLKNSKTNTNLLNNYNYQPSLHVHDLTNSNTNELSNATNLSNKSSILSDTNQNNEDRISPELINVFKTEKNDHLIRAKLVHLNSFILSRNTSLTKSNDSSNLNSAISNSTNTASLSSTDINTNKVIFNLNEDQSIHNSNEYLNQIESQQYDYLNEEHEHNRTESNLYLNRKKIYSEFLRKRLRKYGLTKTCDEIRKVILNTLSHALLALQIDRCERSALTRLNDHYYYHLMPLHHKCKESINNFYFDEESIRYGVHSDSFKRLCLPSFRPLYLYLNNVILDLMHLCIEMQNENKRDIKIQSNYSLSLLSIEVITNECRECIEQSILVRQFYYHMIYSVFDRDELDVQTSLENDLFKFDEDLKETISIYLTFITDWVHGLVRIGDLPKALWVLENEWNFCKNNLYFVTASEDIYASRFCTMSSHINESIIHMLNEIDSKYKEPLKEHIAEIEMKECTSSGINLFDSLPHESDFNNKNKYDSSENENENNVNLTNINKPVAISSDSDKLNNKKKFHFKHEQDLEQEEDQYDDDDDIDDEYDDEYDDNVNEDTINFNEFKEEINRMRKSCMKALNFFAKFISDLELAAKYSIRSSIQELLNELKSSNHVLVSFTNPELNSCSFMIFVPQEFTKDKIQIVRLLFIISEKNDYEQTTNSSTTTETTTNQTSNDTMTQSKHTHFVRRLSSSNSFFESNSELQRDNFLKKLSEFANMNHNVINSGRTSPINPAHHNTGQASTFLVNPTTKTDGYLLYVQLPSKNKTETWNWTGPTIELYASQPVRRSLYQHSQKTQSDQSASNLILVTSKQSILNEKRIELKKKLKGTISLIKEKASFHPSIDLAIDELKDNIIQLSKDSIQWIKSMEKDLKISSPIDKVQEVKLHMTKIDQRYINEIWRVSYNFGIDLQNEIIKFMTQDRAEIFSQGLSDFSILWCEYIVNNTARGKGRTMRPWAANKGIQLIQQAVFHSINLKDNDFRRLVISVEKCILHVIGDRSNQTSNIVQSPSYNFNLRPSNSLIDSKQVYHENTLIDIQNKSMPFVNDKADRRASFCSNASSKKNNKQLPPRKRFDVACLRADEKREKILLEKRYIGKILDLTRPDYIINATEVQFRWQLGLLIGEGNYGKVYSCVNLDNGEPMAMKVISFRSNDVKRIKEIADEINNVCDIDHQNLVKVYGAELHRKEILIFMEFCGDQCTLERISRDASGLPEKIVRDYTKSLLKAVEHLHEQKIMHRDIKGANIFLKSTDARHPEKVVLKLGDFGCSIRFKDPIGPGNKEKATGFMGTFAFMAPEVMAISGARDGGYTYSADIWSVGCVVIEMFTGKKPWHPFKDEKILYKVHIECKQQKPDYPCPISDEAVNFLDCCLEFDPNKRWAADHLLEHRFVKVAEDTYQE